MISNSFSSLFQTRARCPFAAISRSASFSQMSALLPKSLLLRLSELTGLGSAPLAKREEEEEQIPTPEADEESTDVAPAADADAIPSSSPLSPPPPLPPLAALDDSALTLSLDNLPPRDLAALSLASQRFRSVACSGDAWRLRFSPHLPKEVVGRLDGASGPEGGAGGGGGGGAAGAAAPSPAAAAPSFGWPSTYAALALSNLLRSPLEWEGVALGMRAAATTAPSEAAAASPAWRVTCHAGHGWEVEREGPAGCEEVPVAPGKKKEEEEEERWPSALMPRSALASSRAKAAATAAAAAAPAARSWLSRSLLPAAPLPTTAPRPLSVASSFSWCEIIQEVDLVYELLRATSWVSSSPPSSSAKATAGEGQANNDGGGGDGGGDGGDSDESSSSPETSKKPTSRSKRNLCWTRQDAEAYLDSGPALVLSFFCASRRVCESALAATLLAVPDFSKTGPVPPYHGRAFFDWKARSEALAASKLPERAAPWGEAGSGAGKWQRLTLPPLRLPPGTRLALVVFRSKDSRFWSGHYGAKLAAPVLAFAATGAELEDAEAAAEETERGREAAAAVRELLFAA